MTENDMRMLLKNYPSHVSKRAFINPLLNVNFLKFYILRNKQVKFLSELKKKRS